MNFRVAVCYGQPDDPAAFDEYYKSVHIPLARKVPGLSGFTWGKCRSLDASAPPYYAVASLYFPTAEAMTSALRSDEMKEAGEDVRNFATGGVTMFTQEEASVHDQ